MHQYLFVPTPETDEQQEVLTWAEFGVASRLLAQTVAESGFRPDLVLSIARGGLPLVRPHVAELRSAVLYTKPRSVVHPDYYWGHTDQ